METYNSDKNELIKLVSIELLIAALIVTAIVLIVLFSGDVSSFIYIDF